MTDHTEKHSSPARPSVDTHGQAISTTTTLGNDSARDSLEKQVPSVTLTPIDPTDRDLEAGHLPAYPDAAACSPTSHRVKQSMECNVWPTQRTLKEQARLAKGKRTCNPLVGLTKRQRWTVKILVLLLVLAAAVGLGVGISRAVGGGVWAGNGKTMDIP